jgi:hypothetical protein
MVTFKNMRKRQKAQMGAYIKANGFHASDGTQFIEGIERLEVPFERDAVKMVGAYLYMLPGAVDGYRELIGVHAAEERELFGTDGTWLLTLPRTTYRYLTMRHKIEKKRYHDAFLYFALFNDEQLAEGSEESAALMRELHESAFKLIDHDRSKLSDEFDRLSKAQQFQVYAGLDDRVFAYELVSDDNDCDFDCLLNFIIPDITGMSVDEVKGDPRISEAISDFKDAVAKRDGMERLGQKNHDATETAA